MSKVLFVVILFWVLFFTSGLCKETNIGNQGFNLDIIDSLNKVSRDLAYIQPSEALEAAYLALESSKLVNYDKGLAYAFRNVAGVVHFQNNYLMGLDYLLKAVEIFESLEDSVGMADTHISFGHIFNRMDTLELSLYHHLKAYEFYKTKNQKDRLLVAMFNLGEVYLRLQQFETAKKILLEGYGLAHELGNVNLQAGFALRLAEYYLSQSQNKEAGMYFEEALSKCETLADSSNKLVLAVTALKYAVLLGNQGNLIRKENLLLQSISVSRKYNLDFVIVEAYHELIFFYMTLGRISEANAYLAEFKDIQALIRRRNMDLSRQFTFNYLESKIVEQEKDFFEVEFNSAQKKLQKSYVSLIILSVLSLALVIFVFLSLKLLRLSKNKENQIRTLFEQKSELNQLIQKIYESAGIGLFEIYIGANGELRIDQYSDFFKKILEVELPEKLRPSDFKHLISSFDLDKFIKAMHSNALIEDFFESNVEFLTFEGKKRWIKVICKASFQPDGALIVRGLAENVTSVQEHKIYLEENLSREKEMNALKSQFIYTASHEFKNPLSAILSSSEILKLYFNKLEEDENSQKIKKHFHKIEKQIQKINQIMNDILLLEKFNHGKIDFVAEKFYVNQFFLELLEDYFNISEIGKKIDYELLPEDVKVSTDKNLLYFIVVNLLSNAEKYTPVGKPVPVLRLSLEENEELLISVEDSGIGIAKEDQNRLFEGFFRASNAKGIKGTGIGLKIVKNFVEFLSGKIEVSSEVGVGSTFTVSIPLSHLEENAHRESSDALTKK